MGCLRPSGRIFILAIGLLLPLSCTAAEATLAYDIRLDVPAQQRKLLESNLDLYRWRGSERLDQAQLRRLVNQAPEQIRTLLSTEGFYTPQVQARLLDQSLPWRVELEVAPGEPARVKALDLDVHGAFADGSEASRQRLERMRLDWSLNPPAVFRHADWEAAKRAALRTLLLDRYPAAVIQASQATVDPAANDVALSLVLDSGPAFSFGELQVDGLKRYPASVIERLNPIRPGEPYAQARLLELQTRLQDSPYFASASVDVETDPARPEQVPVRVSVTENKARTLGLGVGMSTDTGPRGQVDYRDLNLLGRAWRLGGTLKLADKEQALTGDLQFPMDRKGYRNGLTAGWTRTDVEGEVTRTLKLGASRSRTEGKHEVAWALDYYLEQQEVSGALNDRRTSLVPSWSWTRRDVDDLLFPRRGYLANIQAAGATQALLSDRSFLRGVVRGAWFHPLGTDGQLILRGELGGVLAQARDGIPSDLLFRTGGDQTVRGYAYQSLGVPEGDAVVGGRALALTSAEYVHWLTPQWGAALFLDAGDAADRFGDLDLALGYGLGARWKSPVGPLSLDGAYGHDTGEWRLHFSMGFSF